MEKNAGLAVSARGCSGGLTTLWSEDIFHLKKSFRTHHWLFVELKHVSNNLILSHFNLYVPVNYVEKKICWQSLLDFLESHSFSNIVVAGDVNIIFKTKEKCGGNQDKDPFLELVDSLI